MSRTIVLTSRQHRTITLVIEGGVITSVENQSGCFFPWVVFGIRVEDVPQGHPLRLVYPNKFR